MGKNEKILNNLSAVAFDNNKCNGCLRCIKACPTEAIRIIENKAALIPERCISCGECARVCLQRARVETFDDFSRLSEYKAPVALICPSIYGQFRNFDDVNILLTVFKNIGFYDVFEVAVGCEILIEQNRKLKEKAPDTAIISNHCPAVVKLIQLKYANLAENVTPLISAEEITAKIALKTVMDSGGFCREDVGIFLISPCSANVAAFRGNTYFDGIFSFSDIYARLLNGMKGVETPESLSIAGQFGIGRGYEGAEARTIGVGNTVFCSGMENVIRVLNDFECGHLDDAGFLDLSCCSGGCVGGAFNIENPYMARSRISRLKRSTPRDYNKNIFMEDEYFLKSAEGQNIFVPAADRKRALMQMMQVKSLYNKLPKYDCGRCGAPSCMAYAEDYIGGLKLKCPYINDKDLKGD